MDTNQNSESTQPEPKPAPINAPEVLNLDQIIKIDELKENSVLVMRFSEFSARVAYTLQALAQRYGEKLKGKGVSVIVLSPQDSIETLEEEKMNSLGWRKQGKIIV